MSLGKKMGAEFIGTFWLVLGGCGSAVLAAAFPEVGIGLLGVSLAFGLTVLTMAYAIGHISGCHLNPAVSVGLVIGGRFPASELAPYVLAQVLGGIAGAAILYVIASGQAGFAISYGLGQGATLVAALWGVFIWKEFAGASRGINKLLALMFLCYVVGLTLIVYAKATGA